MRRVYINIAVFAVLTTVLIAWSAATLFPIDAINKPYRVAVQFEESPGLRTGYEVTYLGFAIGNVDSVSLGEGFSEVVLEIDNGVELPAAVDAAARRRSAIGEPYVDLSPTAGTESSEGPRLEDGAIIPIERTTSPIRYGELFSALDQLVSSIDAEQLGTVFDEVALAVDGRGDDFRQLVIGGRDLVTSASDNGDEIEGFVNDLARIADVAATNRDAIGSTIDNLSALTDTLQEATPSADAFLDSFPSSIGMFNRILDASDASLVCVLDGLAVVDAALDGPTLASLESVLERSAETSRVIESVTSDPDGFVRLFMQFTAGVPTVVYAERLPLPSVPTVPGCPDRVFTPEVVDAAGSTGDGPGGTPTGPDEPGSVVPPESEAEPDEVAIGETDLAADQDPFLVKAIKSVVPFIVGLALLAALAYAAWRILAAVRSDDDDDDELSDDGTVSNESVEETVNG